MAKHHKKSDSMVSKWGIMPCLQLAISPTLYVVMASHYVHFNHTNKLFSSISYLNLIILLNTDTV